MIDAARYGRWAVIAGGSEGVGAAFADQLAAAGLNLVLVARSPAPLEATAAAARAHGVEVRTVPLDLLRPDAVDEIRRATEGLDVGLLVFNAGANTYGHDVVSGDLTRLREVIELNVIRQLELAHHFGGPMRERRRGGLLFVGSLAGYLGQPELAVYSAAKAFARIFAEGLWLELKPYDVHVLHLVLGVTRTPAMERAGLRFDLPGLQVAEAAVVAAEGLARLANGPVWIAGDNSRTVEQRSGMNRAELVERAAAGHRRLLGRTT